jgi:hypothetical protein
MAKRSPYDSPPRPLQYELAAQALVGFNLNAPKSTTNHPTLGMPLLARTSYPGVQLYCSMCVLRARILNTLYLQAPGGTSRGIQPIRVLKAHKHTAKWASPNAAHKHAHARSHQHAFFFFLPVVISILSHIFPKEVQQETTKQPNKQTNRPLGRPAKQAAHTPTCCTHILSSRVAFAPPASARARTRSHGPRTCQSD